MTCYLGINGREIFEAFQKAWTPVPTLMEYDGRYFLVAKLLDENWGDGYHYSIYDLSDKSLEGKMARFDILDAHGCARVHFVDV